MNNGIINEIKIRNGQHPLNVLSTVENEPDAWIFLSEEVIEKLSKETFYYGRCEEEGYEGYRFMCFHESDEHPRKSFIYCRSNSNGWHLYGGVSYKNAIRPLPRIPKKIIYIDFDVE